MRKLIIGMMLTLVLLGSAFADDLCPNEGKNSCGRYKRQCELTLKNYKNNVHDDDFKTTLLWNEVRRIFNNMKRTIEHLETVFQGESERIFPEDTDEDKKADLLDYWKDEYWKSCSNFHYYPNFLSCMSTALSYIENIDEQYKSKINTYDYTQVCNKCRNVTEEQFGATCESQGFLEIERKIYGFSDDDTSEKENGLSNSCPSLTENYSKNGGCSTFVDDEGRYCNESNGIQLYRESLSMNEKTALGHTEAQQKSAFQAYLTATKKNASDYSFGSSQGICNIQKLIGVKENGKLGQDTIKAYLGYDFCAKIPKQEGEESHWVYNNMGCEKQFDEIEKTEKKEASQQAQKCGEHAYTCENGINPSNEKYNEKEKTCTRNCGETSCPEDGKAVNCSTYSEAEQQLGIGLNKDCLVHGGCSLDVYKTLGIRQNSEKETRTSVLSFFQDVIGASTFFIGTILTIAFVISGFRYVMAGANGNDPQNAKNGMKYSIIGFVLVMSAYAIIRFVQYLASTGG